jgi:hypothetical protein
MMGESQLLTDHRIRSDEKRAPTEISSRPVPSLQI